MKEAAPFAQFGRASLSCPLTLLLLTGGCDDMSKQRKQNAYRVPSGDPARIVPGTLNSQDVLSSPPRLSMSLLQRGQDGFRSFCTPCHSELGDGLGMVVQRGFSPPPSYHIDRLREGSTAHFFDVMTNGYGAMYSFAQRIAPADRWAIAAYIRALQRSETTTLADLSPAQRSMLWSSQPVQP